MYTCMYIYIDMYVFIYIYMYIHICIFIHPDALRANPPPCFFKEIANLRRGVFWGKRSPPWHGKMRIRSTMCTCLGGRSPSQENTPNDMVICVCDLLAGWQRGPRW